MADIVNLSLHNIIDEHEVSMTLRPSTSLTDTCADVVRYFRETRLHLRQLPPAMPSQIAARVTLIDFRNWCVSGGKSINHRMFWWSERFPTLLERYELKFYSFCWILTNKGFSNSGRYITALFTTKRTFALIGSEITWGLLWSDTRLVGVKCHNNLIPW